MKVPERKSTLRFSEKDRENIKRIIASGRVQTTADAVRIGLADAAQMDTALEQIADALKVSIRTAGPTTSLCHAAIYRQPMRGPHPVALRLICTGKKPGPRTHRGTCLYVFGFQDRPGFCPRCIRKLRARWPKRTAQFDEWSKYGKAVMR